MKGTSACWRVETGRTRRITDAALPRRRGSRSPQEDGKATFYFDDLGKPLATITGANRHNGYRHFLKLGMYRHPEISPDNSIHLDSVAITHETPE